MQPLPAPPISVKVKETEENDISVKLCKAQWADNALKMINRAKTQDKKKLYSSTFRKISHHFSEIYIHFFFFNNYGGYK